MLETLEKMSKEELLRHLIEGQKLNEQLKRQNEKLEQSQSRLEKNTSHLESEVVHLKLTIEKFKGILFGRKRERYVSNPDQMTLPFEMPLVEEEKLEAETKQKITYERKKATAQSHPGRAVLPEHLPVEIIEIYPEVDTTDMVCIGEEVTEELEYKPASYFIKRYIRYKFAPKDKSGVFIGSLPDRLIEKGIAGPGLMASILVDKYVDHLPLYRQVQRFKRENIPIPSSTLDGWTKQAGQFILILYEYLLKDIRAKGYLQADETPIKVQDGLKKGNCHQGYYWVYHCPLDGSILFDYQPGRGTRAASNILENFKGYLQTDGYGVYDHFGTKEDVIHVGCWAHARREFHDALSNDKERAEMALGFIQILYRIEEQGRDLTPEQLKTLRLDKSLPVLNQFSTWMRDTIVSGKVLPKSPIGKAILYSLNRWDKLNAYLYDGSLLIDNNLIENTIRPLAIGRKNYLFAGSHEAAKRAAAIYSFFAMCKKEEVNPYHWLKYVLENISSTKLSQLRTLYPANFKLLSQK